MKTAGIATIIESGPGKVLAGLIKRIERDMKALAINDTSSLEIALQEAEK
jgi:[acyl-carrier-protein] S-malonyltransferase